MSKFIKSKRKRAVIRQEAHVWLKAIERGVVYHEVNDILCNIALINLEACAATRLPSVCKTIILPHLRKKIPLGGGHVENESGTEDGEEKTNLVLTPALSDTVTTVSLRIVEELKNIHPGGTYGTFLNYSLGLNFFIEM